jgi:DNA polymerase-3 subunit delta
MVMDSLAYLQGGKRSTVQATYVLHGDEVFLKRQVLLALRKRIFGEGADDFSLSSYPGDKAEFSAVRNELETLPFLGQRRLVIIENADPFVTRHRQALESYVRQPAEKGILVLDVKTWPANTRLAKLVPAEATLVCKAPAAYRLPDWCVQWARSEYGKELPLPAAKLLVELVGADMGRLDQELAKLSAYAGTASRVEMQEVDRLVGHSRTENTFKIFDAIAAGQSAAALAILDRLFEQGEEPIRILGAFSHQLRRLAQVGRLARQGMPIGMTLNELEVPPFARDSCEQQLRHLGSERWERLYDWLLEIDQGMKGGSSLAPRILLERLVIELAQPKKTGGRRLAASASSTV